MSTGSCTLKKVGVAKDQISVIKEGECLCEEKQTKFPSFFLLNFFLEIRVMVY